MHDCTSFRQDLLVVDITAVEREEACTNNEGEHCRADVCYVVTYHCDVV